MRGLLTNVAISAVLLTSVLAHPHQEPSGPELASRSGLSKRCEASVAAMNKRRWEKRNEKRAAGNTTWSITTTSPYYDTLQNTTCILTEEVTTGPYIWPQSQTLRQDIREGEAGVEMLLDIGVMDMETCEPLPDVLVDIWHCNATGSYSSFTGLNPDTPFEELLTELNKTIGEDLHTDDATFLRGIVSVLLSLPSSLD
jgi:protocatechuate 3,4-dioxygenase beta subunit